MFILFIVMVFLLVLMLNTLFFSLSKKEKSESGMNSSFESGFMSYFFSRFSFSIHYFMVGLIFLLLDLELCFIMPFLNESTFSDKMNLMMNTFISILIFSLILEWREGKLNWMY